MVTTLTIEITWAHRSFLTWSFRHYGDLEFLCFRQCGGTLSYIKAFKLYCWILAVFNKSSGPSFLISYFYYSWNRKINNVGRVHILRLCNLDSGPQSRIVTVIFNKSRPPIGIISHVHMQLILVTRRFLIDLCSVSIHLIGGSARAWVTAMLPLKVACIYCFLSLPYHLETLLCSIVDSGAEQGQQQLNFSLLGSLSYMHLFKSFFKMLQLLISSSRLLWLQTKFFGPF